MGDSSRYYIGVSSGMACIIWDKESDWQRRWDLDMRKYPFFPDSTNHTIVILVNAAYFTDTEGPSRIDIVIPHT